MTMPDLILFVKNTSLKNNHNPVFRLLRKARPVVDEKFQ
jgi:hypothetical protein